MLSIFLFNSLLTPTLWLLDASYWYLTYKRKNLEKLLLEKKEIITITQEQANKMFENNSIDIAFKFSYIGKTILLTLLFIPLFPLGLFISIIGLIYAFFIEK